MYYTCFLCAIIGWCCKYMCYIYKYEKLYFPFLSDGTQRHSGSLNNGNDIEICCSMVNVEQVIFSIYDLIIIIYISKTTCILVTMCYPDMYKIRLYTININCSTFISDMMSMYIIYMFFICHTLYMYTYIYQ